MPHEEKFAPWKRRKTPQGTRNRNSIRISIATVIAMGLVAANVLSINHFGIQPFGAPSPAYAAAISLSPPENTTVTTNPFNFNGTANPGNSINVTTGAAGEECAAFADGAGVFSCDTPALTPDHGYSFGAVQTDLTGDVFAAFTAEALSPQEEISEPIHEY
ncbi:MAG: hypothetical protein WBA28_06285 [Microbacteriaceae bacterium]